VGGVVNPAFLAVWVTGAVVGLCVYGYIKGENEYGNVFEQDRRLAVSASICVWPVTVAIAVAVAVLVGPFFAGKWLRRRRESPR